MIKLTGRNIKISRLFQLSILFLMLGIVSTLAHRHFKHAEVKHYILGSDMEGYYQYLPFFFLHEWDDFDHLPWAKPYEDGKSLSVYTCGVAILESPFFIAAHLTSVFLQLEDQDGYSNVYYTFIFFSALFYALTGLLFIYKTLLRYFSEKTALWASALTFFATNLYYYTIFSPGMSHVYSFALLAMYIYFVPVFYEKPTFKNTTFLILPLALATLIRPTNLIAAIYFILYGITIIPLLKQRMLFLIRKWYLLLLMLVAGILVFVPQMAYWHKVTGHMFFYSYQNEGFPFILKPHISTVLFGARNGWYIYTPMMFFASLSLFYLVYKRMYSSLGILLPMVFIVYIDGSWWAPTFSAAAGYRALIDFLPFMAIPLAYLLQQIYNSENKFLKNMITVLIVFLVFYNIQFAFKYDSWLWWDTGWQWKYLLRIFQF